LMMNGLTKCSIYSKPTLFADILYVVLTKHGQKNNKKKFQGWWSGLRGRVMA
jgi:hypothetical protein